MNKLFYLQDSRSYVGNDVLWWAKGGGEGYTTDLRTIANTFRGYMLGQTSIVMAQTVVTAIDEYIANATPDRARAQEVK